MPQVPPALGPAVLGQNGAERGFERRGRREEGLGERRAGQCDTHCALPGSVPGTGRRGSGEHICLHSWLPLSLGLTWCSRGPRGLGTGPRASTAFVTRSGQRLVVGHTRYVATQSLHRRACSRRYSGWLLFHH